MEINSFFEDKSKEGSVYASSIGMFNEENENQDNDVIQITAKDYLDEYFSKENKENIPPKYIYHAQKENVKLLTPSVKGGAIVVSPYVGIASCFIVDLNDIKQKYFPDKKDLKQYQDYGYIQWFYPPEKLAKPFNSIVIWVRDPEFKSVTGTSEGYIYCIDYAKYSKYLSQIRSINKNVQQNERLLFADSVSYVKKYKLIVKYIVVKTKEKENGK
jgi:hypothetical protein